MIVLVVNLFHGNLVSIKSKFNKLGDTAVLEYFQCLASTFRLVSVAPLKQMTCEAAGDSLVESLLCRRAWLQHGNVKLL